MARITFRDGRWLELRPMWVDDELTIEELGTAGSELDEAEGEDAEVKARRYYALLRKTKALIDEATLAASWEGGAGRLTSSDMLGVIGQWRRASEDDALPPDSGSGSGT